MRIEISANNRVMELDCAAVLHEGGVLRITRDGQTLAEFSTWDYWRVKEEANAV